MKSASSISDSLLQFEAGSDNIGWFERGLHEPRAGSKSFDYGAPAWAVLFTGRDANDWDGVGIAQSIADSIPYSRLASLHPGAAWTPGSETGWGGPPTSLLVRDEAPWLVAVANAIAATITRPGHEVTVRTVPASELASRRASRLFGLALDVVRAPVSGSLGAAVALATANDPRARRRRHASSAEARRGARAHPDANVQVRRRRGGQSVGRPCPGARPRTVAQRRRLRPGRLVPRPPLSDDA